ncbi:MAG: hypothetical protein JNL32_16505, partial [Candidatus Kapabacteria bacterium]|nr:hypothetical protein [Candidatus Kapabacteria bacterium]
MADMQAITGQDQNSITFPPVFVSTTDLHLDPAATANTFLDNKGSPLSSVGTDIDNQSRNGSSPDIGADEMTAAATCSSAVAGTLSPAASSICVTQSLSLQPNNLSGGLGATYQWEVATVSGGTYSNVATGTGATNFQYNTNGAWAPGVYYLRMQASCPSASLNGFSNEYTLTVAAQPTLSVSGYSSSICSGNSLTLTASGASTYTWSTNSTSASIVVTPGTTSSYFVSASNAPCPTVVSPNLVINVLSVPSLTTSISSSTICTGKTATLTVNGATTYSWSNGMNSATITPVINSAGINTLTVIGFNGICSATASRTINALSTPTLSIGGPTAACAGQTLNLTVSGSSLVSWSTGSTSKTITVTAPLVYTVTG